MGLNVDIDIDTKELVILIGAMAAAAGGLILDGLSTDQFMTVLLMCLAYGFGKYNGGSKTPP